MTANGTHRKVRVATAQFYSHTDVAANVELSRKYIREAAAAGAQLIVLPENANRTRIDYKDRETAYQLCESINGVYITGLCETAKELNIFIVAGVDLKADVSPNCHVAVVLIGNDGAVLYVHHKTVLVSVRCTLGTKTANKTIASGIMNMAYFYQVPKKSKSSKHLSAKSVFSAAQMALYQKCRGSLRLKGPKYCATA